MFGWFKKRPSTPPERQAHAGVILAWPEEREELLAKQHAVFREVDTGFHMYLEIITANPLWDDDRIEQELIRRGIEAGLAEECVTFGPMAWGHEVAEQLGVVCSPLYRLHSMIDGGEQDMPLANELVYAWARAMIGLYRIPGRNEVFNLVSRRSAEVNAINNALRGGVSVADMRGSKLQPSLVHFRRAVAKCEAPAE